MKRPEFRQENQSASRLFDRSEYMEGCVDRVRIVRLPILSKARNAVSKRFEPISRVLSFSTGIMRVGRFRFLDALSLRP